MAIKIYDNREGTFRNSDKKFISVDVFFSDAELELIKHFEQNLEIKLKDQIDFILNGLFPKDKKGYCDIMRKGVKKKSDISDLLGISLPTYFGQLLCRLYLNIQ